MNILISILIPVFAVARSFHENAMAEYKAWAFPPPCTLNQKANGMAHGLEVQQCFRPFLSAADFNHFLTLDIEKFPNDATTFWRMVAQAHRRHPQTVPTVCACVQEHSIHLPQTCSPFAEIKPIHAMCHSVVGCAINLTAILDLFLTCRAVGITVHDWSPLCTADACRVAMAAAHDDMHMLGLCVRNIPEDEQLLMKTIFHHPLELVLQAVESGPDALYDMLCAEVQQGEGTFTSNVSVVSVGTYPPYAIGSNCKHMLDYDIEPDHEEVISPQVAWCGGFHGGFTCCASWHGHPCHFAINTSWCGAHPQNLATSTLFLRRWGEVLLCCLLLGTMFTYSRPRN